MTPYSLTPYNPTPPQTRNRSDSFHSSRFSSDHQTLAFPDQLVCRVNIGRGVYDERWEFFYEHTGTGLQSFPVPEIKPLGLARHLDQLAEQHGATQPAAIVEEEMP